MMPWLRQMISYAVTLAALVALVTIVPRCARLRVPPGYSDIATLDVDRSLTGDAGARFSDLAVGDGIAFRLGDQESLALCLGWVAALPGDTVAITNKFLMVNGAKSVHSQPLDMPDRAAVMIPLGHCFVLSDQHLFDSLAYGPLPAAALRAKLASLP